MPVVSSPLLKDWTLLREEVVPALVDAGRQRRVPSLWSLGGVADAVAVVAAFRSACADQSEGDVDVRVRAFATAERRVLGPISFSLSDIRCIPAGTRYGSFERRDRRWVAGEDLCRQVFLSEPDQPLDVVLVPSDVPAERADAAVGLLRAGGRLVLVGPPGPGHVVAGGAGLEAVDPGRGLYAKSGPAKRPSFRASGPSNGPDPRSSLAAHQAQSDLVTSHIRLARSLARRFSHHGEAKEDLEQVALIALVKAARRYDTSHETSFSTYATASILGEIKRHFRDKTWSMRVPRSVQESYLAVKEARETLTHELRRSPTITQIAERIGISDEAVLEAMEAGDNYWPESLDVGGFEGDPGKDVPVEEGGFDLALDRQRFSAIVDRLSPRERLILKRLYFDNWTQREVADEIGVSQMQVSRLLGRLMERLRAGA